MPATRLRSTWDDRYILRAYELAKSGLKKHKLYKAMGIGQKAFETWYKKKPALREAIERGYEQAGGINEQGTFREYVYKRLSPELKVLWDEINMCEKTKDAYIKVQCLLKQHSQRVRQHLFLYAYVSTSFDTSKAMKKVCISYHTFKKWAQDPAFAELLDEIHFHKGNYFEAALFRLVKSGNTAAILHVNRTFNAGRGYGDKSKVEVTGHVTHKQALTLEDLGLDLETKRTLLAAVRAKTSPVAALPDPADYEDAEFTKNG